MSHCAETEEIKAAVKRRRRVADKKSVAEQVEADMRELGSRNGATDATG